MFRTSATPRTTPNPMLNRLTVLRFVLCLPALAGVVTADIIGLEDPKQQPSDSEHIEQARRVLRIQGVPAARQLLKQHLANSENQPHPEILLARLLNQSQQAPTAARVLEDLARTEPDRLDLRFVFGELAVQQSRWFDAWIHLQAASQANAPENWTDEHLAKVSRDLKLLTARCCEGRRDWETASGHYFELIQSANSEDDVVTDQLWTALGRCEFHQDHLEEASRHLNRAWQANPKMDVPSLVLAALCRDAGRTEDATKFFRKAIAHRDEAGRAKAQLAFAGWLLWNNQPAELRTVLTSELPDSAMERERRFKLAMADRMEHRYEAAGEALVALHQADPNDFAVGNQLALVLIESTDEAVRSRALQIAEANARNHSQMSEAWSSLGWIQFRLGDLASARQNLAKAMSGGAISRDTAWQLAQVHQRLGNIRKSQELLTAAKTSQGPFFSAVDGSQN